MRISDLIIPISGATDDSLYLDKNTRIQILQSIDQLPQAEKDQCGAFIVRSPHFFYFSSSFLTPGIALQRDENAVVLWSYALEGIIPLCREFEEKLIKHIWRTRAIGRKDTPSLASSLNSQTREEVLPELNEKEAEEQSSKDESKDSLTEKPKRTPSTKGNWWGWKLKPRDQNAGAVVNADSEKGAPGKREERKLVLIGPMYAGLGAALAACTFFVVILSATLNPYVCVRFHGVGYSCAPRRIRPRWEYDSVCAAGYFACHILRFHRTSISSLSYYSTE